MSKGSPGSLAKNAAEDKELLSELLIGILSSRPSTKHNSFKALTLLSEEHPEVLYTAWDYFAHMIYSGDSSAKYIALHIIANLTKVDSEKKFENIFEKYHQLLDDQSVVTAVHLARNSGKIAKAKPELQNRITEMLLRIDRTRHSAEHRNLIKSYVIESLGEYFEEAKNKAEIVRFVKRQVQNKSPRARKKAKEFLKKWENPQ